ncbi:hypothetical protein HMPREF9163_02247 [Selenomonas sp. oral taxon 138 str. F0429]|nr:hypothetical protein HMPREF9163_02247 [Selenomonas sp. oral taxon 138 str. F0429]
MGRDLEKSIVQMLKGSFQSTRPVRGATLHERDNVTCIGVSIHAPRAGRDHGDVHSR